MSFVFLFLRAFSAPLALPVVVAAVLKTNRDRAQGRSTPSSQSPSPVLGPPSLRQSPEAAIQGPSPVRPTPDSPNPVFIVPWRTPLVASHHSNIFLGNRRRKFEMPPSWKISFLGGHGSFGHIGGGHFSWPKRAFLPNVFAIC